MSYTILLLVQNYQKFLVQTFGVSEEFLDDEQDGRFDTLL